MRDRKELEELLAYHQTRADAIRLTLSLLDGTVSEKKQTGIGTVLRQAAALDSERRKAQPVRSGTLAAVRASRQRTAEKLASMSRTEPQPGEKGFGPLVQAGYIKAKGDGYVRTTKPFKITQRHDDDGDDRTRTAKRLAAMSMTEPKPYGSGAGILKYHGYLIEKDNGYVRTAKPFIP